jgi:hypothetical protein
MFEIYVLQRSRDEKWQLLAEFKTLSETMGVASMALCKFHLWCVRILPAERTWATGKEIERDDPYWVRYESKLALTRIEQE